MVTRELTNLKIYRNDKNEEYIIPEKDTVFIDLKMINSDLYEMSGPIFNHTYTPAQNHRLKSSEVDEIFKIIGNSYQFEIDEIEYLISFYNYSSILRFSDSENEYINLVYWGIAMVDEYVFLSIQMENETLKFQVEDINSETITLDRFTEFGTENVEMVRVNGNDFFKSVKYWKYEKDVDYSILNISNPLSELDDFKNHFRAYDLTEESNVYGEDEGVYIDWNSSSIILSNNSIFEIEILNGRRIEIFPVLGNGKINRLYSKIYYTID